MQTIALLAVAYLVLGGTNKAAATPPPPKPPPGTDVGGIVQGFVTGLASAYEQWQKQHNS